MFGIDLFDFEYGCYVWSVLGVDMEYWGDWYVYVVGIEQVDVVQVVDG